MAMNKTHLHLGSHTCPVIYPQPPGNSMPRCCTNQLLGASPLLSLSLLLGRSQLYTVMLATSHLCVGKGALNKFANEQRTYVEDHGGGQWPKRTDSESAGETYKMYGIQFIHVLFRLFLANAIPVFPRLNAQRIAK